MQLAVIAFRHSVDAHKGADAGPDALLQAGLTDGLCEEGHKVIGPFHVELTADEEAAYGAWNRIGFANARLAESISEAMREQAFPLLLESNCYAAIGALAGLRKSANSPLRLGMVWIDAHGDCNTPETTLSGMLSGMPVAIATGLCLHRFRKQAGLDSPIDARDVVMVCVRANDPLEQKLIDQSGMEIVPVTDVKGDCCQLDAAMKRLSGAVDLIYVHFDIDALDRSELALTRLAEPDGPSTAELTAAVKRIMNFPKIGAFGIADINPERDIDGKIVQSAIAVIRGGVEGLALRVGPESS
jgi:arginase